PIGIIADLTAPALLFVQTIGRLGDFVNGEHCAKAWDFALAFVWTNPASDARVCANGVGASVHPVIAYEVIWNMISLVIIWKLRDRLKPDGMLFALYFALYSIGRFGVTFLRQDRIWAIGLQEAQFIALIVLAITVPLLLIKARPVPADEMQIEPPEPRQRGTRAERRRRERDG
ncbi:MAG: prolipoprotein diacylglyceryl transferase, partial [SAR202 cluster bacterium]|nr:prolipoprotein diacylglyceryl transferase [SAR202 cluster bacterium]